MLRLQTQAAGLGGRKIQVFIAQKDVQIHSWELQQKRGMDFHQVILDSVLAHSKCCIMHMNKMVTLWPNPIQGLCQWITQFCCKAHSSNTKGTSPSCALEKLLTMARGSKYTPGTHSAHISTNRLAVVGVLGRIGMGHGLIRGGWEGLVYNSACHNPSCLFPVRHHHPHPKAPWT